MNLPKYLLQKLENRKLNNSLRNLSEQNNLVDFSSNDYLGFAKNDVIFNETHQYLVNRNIKINGATGSRLLSGNHNLYTDTEQLIAEFHQSESALMFNSGYDANVGFFSAVPQRNDVILYDEWCHASIRDGIRLSNAKSYKFNHNDFEDLEKLILRFIIHNSQSTIYIATESVFSMDGDCPDLEKMVQISNKHSCKLVVDEAHALGVFGNLENFGSEGLVQKHHLQDNVFARIVTFGKGLGCHGAAVLGCQNLKDYLINFSRSFIYTTGLSPHAVATIKQAYIFLENNKAIVEKLRENIIFFNKQKELLGLSSIFVGSESAIQSAIITGNVTVKNIAHQLQINNFDVRPILSPTVAEGQERLRICLHSYNSENEILELLQVLRMLV
jgi:8-amino-7-oxononanoate synthase